MTQSPAPRNLGSSYLMDCRIGAGAQGEVWRGRRVDAREILAFKVLRADLVENPDVVERFIKERSTLLRVRSPYVVAIRDVVIEGSTFAIVMDYVNGGDLRDLLRAHGALPPVLVASLGARIAQGLAAVHHAGVIHRDIKPANVLLGSRPSAGGDPDETVVTGVAPGGVVPETVVPRLADFGVARICDTFSSSHLTGAIGTPLYMAPEILSMQAPTSAADIYSLGIMLYEMSCGTTPFVGKPAQLLSQHARRDPGRPDGVPNVLWELISSMTAKQPSRRPSIDYVAQRLDLMQTALVGLPAAPRLVSPPQSTSSVVPYDWDTPSSEVAIKPMMPAGSVTDPATASASLATPSLMGGQQYAYVPDTAGSGTSGATARTPGGMPDGNGVSPDRLYTQPAFHSGYTALEPDDGSRRRWRRRRWMAVAAVVTVLAVAGVGATWWYFFSGPEVGSTWPAALPAGNSVHEDQRYSEVYDPVVSEDGTMLTYKHSSKTHLVDLTKSTTKPVWSGDCDKVNFWAGRSLFCGKFSGDPSIVSSEGKTSGVPFPKGASYVGSTESLGIAALKGDSFEGGSLVGYNVTGKEKWRASGGYTEGRVRNGFILTYENKSRQIQILSAASGEVLVSEPGKKPDFDKDTRFPGGFNIETGPEAFSRMTSSSATIYKADGGEVGTVSGTFAEEHLWATSVPLDASALKEAYTSLAKAPSSTTPVIGPSGTVDVMIDVSACTVKASNKKLALPAPAKGEDCYIRPIGALSDGQLLFQVGEYSPLASDTGNLVVAVSPESGKVGWKVPGTYSATVAAQKNQSSARLMVAQGGSYNFDLVVSSITIR